jgi:uncharacterized protein YjbI with pentapeptide repeats
VKPDKLAWAAAAGIPAGASAAFAGASPIAMVVLGILVAVGVLLWLIDPNKDWGDLGQGLLVGIVVSLVLLFVQRDADQRLRAVNDRQEHQSHMADVRRERAASKQTLRLELSRESALRELSLPDADLSGFRFPHRRMAGADLARANLSLVDFGGADLRRLSAPGARFASTWLEKADLREAHVDAANFAGATLEEANLRGIHATGARFTGAWMAGADLRKGTFEREETDVQSAFSDPGAERTRPEDAPQADEATPASFLRAQLRRARLDELTLNGVDFRSARMRQVELPGAKLAGANLTDANLTRANLSGTDLRGAVLSRAIVTGVDVNGACYDDTTRWPAGFDPARAGAEYALDSLARSCLGTGGFVPAR